jgi:hypothetical protein
MQRVRHFWRKVPEIERVGSNAETGIRQVAAASLNRRNPVVPLMPKTKTELHRLVDALPDESLPSAAILLRRAQDPVAAKLDAAPYDDEALTDEDLRAIKEARSEPGISWSDAERR